MTSDSSLHLSGLGGQTDGLSLISPESVVSTHKKDPKKRCRKKLVESFSYLFSISRDEICVWKEPWMPNNLKIKPCIVKWSRVKGKTKRNVDTGLKEHVQSTASNKFCKVYWTSMILQLSWTHVKLGSVLKAIITGTEVRKWANYLICASLFLHCKNLWTFAPQASALQCTEGNGRKDHLEICFSPPILTNGLLSLSHPAWPSHDLVCRTTFLTKGSQRKPLPKTCVTFWVKNGTFKILFEPTSGSGLYFKSCVDCQPKISLKFKVIDADGLCECSGSRRYHKACHKCCSCGKLLAPGKAHLHNGDPHCRFVLIFTFFTNFYKLHLTEMGLDKRYFKIRSCMISHGFAMQLHFKRKWLKIHLTGLVIQHPRAYFAGLVIVFYRFRGNIESWSHRTCHAAAIQPASPDLFPDTTTIKLVMTRIVDSDELMIMTMNRWLWWPRPVMMMMKLLNWEMFLQRRWRRSLSDMRWSCFWGWEGHSSPICLYELSTFGRFQHCQMLQL